MSLGYNSATPWYGKMVLVVVYVFSWSGASVADKLALETMDELLLSGCIFATALAINVIMFWMHGSRAGMGDINTIAMTVTRNPYVPWSCILTATGYITYFMLLKRSPLYSFVVLTQCIEVASMIMSFMILGEAANSVEVIGMGFVVLGGACFILGQHVDMD